MKNSIEELNSTFELVEGKKSVNSGPFTISEDRSI